MGQEHVDRVREGIHKMSFDLVDLFGDGSRGDPASAFDVGGLAPDIEIVFVGPAPGVSDFHYTGLEGLAEGWRDWLEPWKTYVVEIEGFVDGGCDVVTLVTLRGETRHGGVTVEQPAAAVWTLADGQVVRVAFHLDRRTALESVGRADALS